MACPSASAGREHVAQHARSASPRRARTARPRPPRPAPRRRTPGRRPTAAAGPAVRAAPGRTLAAAPLPAHSRAKSPAFSSTYSRREPPRPGHQQPERQVQHLAPVQAGSGAPGARPAGSADGDAQRHRQPVAGHAEVDLPEPQREERRLHGAGRGGVAGSRWPRAGAHQQPDPQRHQRDRQDLRGGQPAEQHAALVGAPDLHQRPEHALADQQPGEHLAVEALARPEPEVQQRRTSAGSAPPGRAAWGAPAATGRRAAISPAFSCASSSALLDGKCTAQGRFDGWPKQQPFRKQPMRVSASPKAIQGAARSAIRHMPSRCLRA